MVSPHGEYRISDRDAIAQQSDAKEALRRFLEKYEGLVMSIIRQVIKDKHLAEDVLQDIWCIVLRIQLRLGSMDELSCRRYLCVIAEREARRANRRLYARRRREKSDEQVERIEDRHRPVGPIDATVLEHLEERTRDALIEVGLKDRSRSDVGLQLGLTGARVGQLLSSLRQDEELIRKLRGYVA